jgi:RNA polymerase sigma-70 factor (ECF subfamily)
VLTRADDVDLSRDRALVESFQAGDTAAFDELYERYHDRLVRYCYRRLGDLHEAEEVTQEAFARALRALPRFDGERRFYPWMTVIAGRLCIDSFRRSSRVAPCEEIDTGAVDGGQDRIVDQVDIDQLRVALDRLHGRHREVLHLRERELQSYQHIADAMGISMSAVETLLFRARRALRREFMALSGESLVAIPVLGRLIRRFGGIRNPFAAEAAPSLGNLTMAVAMVAAVACGGVAAGSHHGTTVAPSVAMIASTTSTAVPATVSPSPTIPDSTTTTAAGAGASHAASSTAAPPPAPAAVPLKPKVMTYQEEQQTAAEAPIYVALEGVGNASLNPAALAANLSSAITPRNQR